MTKKADYGILFIVGFLILLGILILASVSASISQQKFGYPSFYLFHHILFGLIPGAILGFIAFKIPLSKIKKWSPALLLGSLFLMVLVFLPVVGITLGGSRSWLNLGITTFQPSELLKLSFVLYLASWLAVRTEKGKKVLSATLVAFLAVLALIALLLVLQPDVGTLGIIILSAILLYFLAGTPWKHTFLLIPGLAGVLALFIRFAPYRMARISVFFNPDIDPMGMGYQIKQALIAIGSGGIFGRGAGMSIQKFGFLPQPMADSIFAVFSEEWGFVGAFILISLFLLFIWRGFSIAKNVNDKFAQLTVLGIVGWITFQAFVNIGSMIGILPLTGIPLPFISYGGSAMVVELIGIGILLNISKNR